MSSKINLETFEGDYPNYFQCVVCHELVDTPVQCKRCDTIMCDCYLIRCFDKCPICNVNQAHRKFNRILNEHYCALKFRCKLCSKDGLTPQDVKQHILKCDKGTAVCPVPNCGFSCVRESMSKHILESEEAHTKALLEFAWESAARANSTAAAPDQLVNTAPPDIGDY